MRQATPTYLLIVVLLLGTAVSARADDDGTQPGDQSLTCDQVNSEVTTQNNIVNTQGALVQKYDSGTGTSVDGVASVTAMDHAKQAIAQRKADAATARGHALVRLGQSKKCFK